MNATPLYSHPPPPSPVLFVCISQALQPAFHHHLATLQNPHTRGHLPAPQHNIPRAVFFKPCVGNQSPHYPLIQRAKYAAARKPPRHVRDARLVHQPAQFPVPMEGDVDTRARSEGDGGHVGCTWEKGDDVFAEGEART